MAKPKYTDPKLVIPAGLLVLFGGLAYLGYRVWKESQIGEIDWENLSDDYYGKNKP